MDDDLASSLCHAMWEVLHNALDHEMSRHKLLTMAYCETPWHDMKPWTFVVNYEGMQASIKHPMGNLR